jgi:hypothetical protein
MTVHGARPFQLTKFQDSRVFEPGNRFERHEQLALIGAAPNGWVSSTRRGGPWTLPRLCTAARAGRAQVAWTGRRPAHSAHRLYR